MAAPRVPKSEGSDLRTFTKSLLKNPLVRAGYERSKADFDVARVVTRLRLGAELTQGQFARLVKSPIETLIDIEAGKNAEAYQPVNLRTRRDIVGFGCR